MNERIDQFTKDLGTKLNRLANQIEGIKLDVRSGEKEGKAAIQSKLKTARFNLKTLENDLKDAEIKAQNWVKEKESATESVIEDWKTKFEKSKLIRHAKNAEGNAQAAVSIAEAKIAGAALAKCEAIDARMAAEEGSTKKH